MQLVLFVNIMFMFDIKRKSNLPAFARKDLPVPGGPYNKIPFHGLILPVNRTGKRIGNITASCNVLFACSNPATSPHVILDGGGTGGGGDGGVLMIVSFHTPC